jgi:hypothetical protein
LCIAAALLAAVASRADPGEAAPAEKSKYGRFFVPPALAQRSKAVWGELQRAYHVGGPGYYLVDNVIRMERHTQSNRGTDLGAPTPDAINPVIDLSGIEVWRPDFGIPNMGQTRLFLQGFVSEVREFCDAIIEEREPSPNGDDSLLTMAVIEAIAASPDGVTSFEEELGE